MHCAGKMFNLCCAMAMPMLRISGHPHLKPEQPTSQSVSLAAHPDWRPAAVRTSVDCASLLMPNCAPAFVEFGFCNLLSMPPRRITKTGRREGGEGCRGSSSGGIKNELSVTGGCRCRCRCRDDDGDGDGDGDGNVIFAKSFRLF